MIHWFFTRTLGIVERHGDPVSLRLAEPLMSWADEKTEDGGRETGGPNTRTTTPTDFNRFEFPDTELILWRSRRGGSETDRGRGTGRPGDLTLAQQPQPISIGLNFQTQN